MRLCLSRCCIHWQTEILWNKGLREKPKQRKQLFFASIFFSASPFCFTASKIANYNRKSWLQFDRGEDYEAGLKQTQTDPSPQSHLHSKYYIVILNIVVFIIQ